MAKKKHLILPSLWDEEKQYQPSVGVQKSETVLSAPKNSIAEGGESVYEKLYGRVNQSESSGSGNALSPAPVNPGSGSSGTATNTEKPNAPISGGMADPGESNAPASGEEVDYVGQALELLASSSREPYTPGTYVSPYANQLDSLINEILGSSYGGYNAEEDPIYKQYKKQYLREADRTQQDVMGQYAALTGGLPSSAAITAASQAGNQMRGELADILPQLAAEDYEKYLAGIDAKRGNLSDLLALENLAYGKFADEENRRLTAWEQEGQLQNEQIAKLLQAIELTDSREDRANAATDTAYSRALGLLAAGVMPSDAELANAGLSADAAKQLMEYLASGGSLSSNPTGISGDPDVTYENALEYLKEQGITDAGGLMDEEQFAAWNGRYGRYSSYEDYIFDYIYQMENG